MDIDLLAKMVKETVMDHDSVTLPGVGSFVAELVPAVFTDRGYTINPPYRRLYFLPREGETLRSAIVLSSFCSRYIKNPGLLIILIRPDFHRLMSVVIDSTVLCHGYT